MNPHERRSGRTNRMLLDALICMSAGAHKKLRIVGYSHDQIRYHLQTQFRDLAKAINLTVARDPKQKHILRWDDREIEFVTIAEHLAVRPHKGCAVFVDHYALE